MNILNSKKAVYITAGLLVIALFIQLYFAANQNSATFDEPAHIYAGYLQWQHGYYTLNPPLTRYLLTSTIIGMRLTEPPITPKPIRIHEMVGGKEFLFQNDTEALLFRTRIVNVFIGIAIAIMVFLVTRKIFGVGAGIISLALVSFDPTLIAHSSLATTDTTQALFLFCTIYAYYYYVKERNLWKLLLVGICAGLSLASKTSAVQLFIVMPLLVLIELLWKKKFATAANNTSSFKQFAYAISSIVAIGLIALVILWGSYGFRYVPADGGLALIPPTEVKLSQVPSKTEAAFLGFADKHHLLPQAYTYGFAHFLIEAASFNSDVLGTIYPHPVWFFFPVAMAIKSSLTFLILLGLSIWAITSGKVKDNRSVIYFAVAALVYLLLSMMGGMNIGVRHVLPVYIYLMPVIGGAVWSIVLINRRWLALVAVLLMFQAISVARTYPAYMAYANELFGGPKEIHKYLSDSNTDWCQQLKGVKQYLDEKKIDSSWFAYFGQGVLEYKKYGINSRELITPDAGFMGDTFDTTAVIDGTVLISAGVLSGFEFGPAPLNPYEQFKKISPVDVIDYSIFVYQGHFDMSYPAALAHINYANRFQRARDLVSALREARRAESLAPECAEVLATLGGALEANHDTNNAVIYFQKALAIAKRDRPDFQAGLIGYLEFKLKGK